MLNNIILNFLTATFCTKQLVGYTRIRILPRPKNLNIKITSIFIFQKSREI